MLFKTQVGWFRPQLLRPFGLCCLQSGDIAVTFAYEGRVIIYSMSGKVIKEPDKKLFKCPFWVAQSKVNNDLYITDKTENYHNSTGKVLALGKGYRVRYEYTGQDDRRFFFPSGLCTDNAGHVLITDYYNDRVHILDRDGRFLQYLLTREQGFRRPLSIAVDSEGNAWVGQTSTCTTADVKVVKYLQWENDETMTHMAETKSKNYFNYEGHVKVNWSYML